MNNQNRCFYLIQLDFYEEFQNRDTYENLFPHSDIRGETCLYSRFKKCKPLCVFPNRRKKKIELQYTFNVIEYYLIT